MGKVANLCGVVLVVVMAAAVAETAAQDTSCLTQLVPCLNFTSSKSTPPSSCCEPLKSLIRTNPQCLCSILQDDSLKKQSGVNATEAQGLPSRCGLNATAAACSGSINPETKNSSAGGSPLAKKLLLVTLFLIIQMCL